MPTEIYLVKVGMTMTEGIVDEWFVADGERVEKGQPVYRLETEKVNMDVEADLSGIVKHLVDAGTTMEPGDVAGWIFADDETIPDVLPIPKPNPNIESIGGDEQEFDHTPISQPARERGGKSRVLASPAARRLAEEIGVDVNNLTGTGPRGRITKEDVEAASQSDKSGNNAGGLNQLTGRRKVIAQRMFESLQQTAQLTIEMEVRMDAAIELRESLNADWVSENLRLTYTDMVIAACVKALQQHSSMNSTLLDGGIQENPEIHMGVAVAIPDGLIVPVIHHAQSKTLKELARESVELAEKARGGNLGIAEVSGGTFTVTSLGMYGVDTFTPILNTNQTGILGIGRIYDSVAWVDESATKVRAMRLSLTWDHRVLDGAPAAEFLATVKSGLESPATLNSS